ncbi:MAG: DUF2027 domain-containing protein [Prolixibacteraceae bacterium]|nr:DUF2027 domain-containing protein [Prolixibacteraceae bacterium]
MIKIGDKVKFLNDVGGGVVISFQSKNIAVVKNEDGFEIPVMINQLVKVPQNEDYENIRRDEPVVKKQKQPEPKPAPAHIPQLINGNDEPRFFIAFYPVDQHNPVGGEIEVYLINDSNFSLLYHYSHFDGKLYKTIDSGELEPNTKNYIEGIAQADLSNLPAFCLQLIPFMKETKKLAAPVVKDIHINGVKFYKEKSFRPNEFFKGNAMVFDLAGTPEKADADKRTDKDLQKLLIQKDEENRPLKKEAPKQKPPEVIEVDLHIHELVDNWNGLSNHEILEIQMDRFHSEMKNAMENRAKRIVFIHGVGNGVLKQEIHKKLKSTYARFYFQDASFQEYGYGATMVIFRRK